MAEFPEKWHSMFTRSQYWKDLRKRILAERGKMCEECYQTDRTLTLHHLTYEHMGAERDDELMLLCTDCHIAAHAEPVTMQEILYHPLPPPAVYERIYWSLVLRHWALDPHKHLVNH